MHDLLDLVATLSETPSRRHRWINWIVWGLALVGVAITLAYYGLLASHALTGWPAA